VHVGSFRVIYVTWQCHYSIFDNNWGIFHKFQYYNYVDDLDGTICKMGHLLLSQHVHDKKISGNGPSKQDVLLFRYPQRR
jgi:hypothetical protein